MIPEIQMVLLIRLLFITGHEVSIGHSTIIAKCDNVNAFIAHCYKDHVLIAFWWKLGLLSKADRRRSWRKGSDVEAEQVNTLFYSLLNSSTIIVKSQMTLYYSLVQNFFFFSINDSRCLLFLYSRWQSSVFSFSHSHILGDVNSSISYPRHQ